MVVRQLFEPRLVEQLDASPPLRIILSAQKPDTMPSYPPTVRGRCYDTLIGFRGLKPTVCLGVTSAVACTYRCGDGRIAPTRCVFIDDRLGDRWSQRRGA